MVIKVILGLSGGVDSSVSAFLLKKQGYHVIGVHMINWHDSQENSKCSSNVDIEDARSVCLKLDIPFYTIDLSDKYKDLVFNPSLREMEMGVTPNPDVLCNKFIKFDKFIEFAKKMNVNFIATGHYARIGTFNEDKVLLRGVDPLKDQSYFLYAINKMALNNIIFPLGEIQKKEVRDIAKDAGLHVFDKKDSVGICFVGKRKFSSFISDYINKNPGDIVSINGEALGRHDGLHLYTIGQRKGLKGGLSDPHYVIDKIVDKNVLVVSKSKSDLYFSKCLMSNINLLISESYLRDMENITCKIRYRSEDIRVHLDLDQKIAKFPNKAYALTRGQSIVFYHKDICLGGAIIKEVFRDVKSQ